VTTIKLDLIPSPDLPADVTSNFIDDLPSFLNGTVDYDVCWDVKMIIDPLVGSAEYMNQLIDKTVQLKHKIIALIMLYDQSNYTNETNDNNIDVRYLVYPRLHGLLRLIIGMTFANNPLKIMSSFKSVIAIAFTTGAFSLIFPTICEPWPTIFSLSSYRYDGYSNTLSSSLDYCCS